MNTTALKTAIAAAALLAASHANAQVTLYENDDFGGRTFNAQQQVSNLRDFGFNDRASSLVIQPNERWEICEDAGFNGRCVVLGAGRYSTLQSMGLNDRVTSLRAVNVTSRHDRDDVRPQQLPAAAPVSQDFRRRNGERIFNANVTSVRAVMGAPEQRCWMERQEVPVERKANVGGAIAGALIGGVLGHQVGGGSGRNIATVGGAVAGGAVGANVNRGDRTEMRDVQRCSETSASQKPEFWDVTYIFRGQEHHVQTTRPPGATIPVNNRGEPRIS